ncbi:MAG: cytochrome c [Hyphomicrobiaceae bacterium]
MQRRQRLSSMFALVVAAAGLAPMAATAQTAPIPPAKDGLELEAPSPERGLAFAQKFCSNCHLVEGGTSATVQAGIPSLRGLANKPGQNGERIRNVLINPHPPMPDMQVSSQEILDVLSYLETLRTDKSVPPFLSPTQKGDKPQYPKPS